MALAWSTGGCALFRGGDNDDPNIGSAIATAALEGARQPTASLPATPPNWTNAVPVAQRDQPTRVAALPPSFETNGLAQAGSAPAQPAMTFGRQAASVPNAARVEPAPLAANSYPAMPSAAAPTPLPMPFVNRAIPAAHDGDAALPAPPRLHGTDGSPVIVHSMPAAAPDVPETTGQPTEQDRRSEELVPLPEPKSSADSVPAGRPVGRLVIPSRATEQTSSLEPGKRLVTPAATAETGARAQTSSVSASAAAPLATTVKKAETTTARASEQAASEPAASATKATSRATKAKTKAVKAKPRHVTKHRTASAKAAQRHGAKMSLRAKSSASAKRAIATAKAQLPKDLGTARERNQASEVAAETALTKARTSAPSTAHMKGNFVGPFAPGSDMPIDVLHSSSLEPAPPGPAPLRAGFDRHSAYRGAHGAVPFGLRRYAGIVPTRTGPPRGSPSPPQERSARPGHKYISESGEPLRPNRRREQPPQLIA